jgi:hypothetical protein
MLAKRRAVKIEQPEILEALITQIGVAQNAEEARKCLRSKSESTRKSKCKQANSPQP